MTTIVETPAPAVPQPSGLQYAVRILLGCVIVWFVLQRIHHPNPLWALISVIIVTEPELSAAFLAFNSRIVNTLIGCAVGLSFLYLLGPSYWSILLGIIVSVIICTSLIRVPGSWRVAPVTVAILMNPSVLGGGRAAGLAVAIDRTEEVLLGSAAALLITYVASLLRRLIRRTVS
ncbi:MAG TPA: FUSC family protein [Candidatus Acidoferrum sp.]